MADKKISQLTNLTGVNLAENDEFVLVDTSADETKAITFGELKTAFDTGTGFVRVTGDTMTGDLSFNGGDTIYGDNDKAIFGAGSDLQIYSNGANSFISESGSGSLFIDGDNISIRSAVSGNYAKFLSNGAAEIYFNGVKKLATTSTGIDVTGTVQADGLSVDGTGVFSSASPNIRLDETDTTDLNTRFRGQAGSFRIETTTDAAGLVGTRLLIDHATGDLSLFEDTGTTPKFFWDASAERLGIGTSSVGAPLEVLAAATSSSDIALFSNSAGVQKAIVRLDVNGDGEFVLRDAGNNEDVVITSGGDTYFKGGNVGIGTSSPTRALHVNSGASNEVARFESTDTEALIELVDTTGSAQIRSRNDFRFYTNGGSTRAMDIDASGNVGIGTTSPARPLSVERDSSSSIVGTFKSANSQGAISLRGSATTSDTAVRFAAEGNDLLSFAGGSERMRIDASGSVGIGVSSPSNGGVLGGKSLHVSAVGETAGVRVENTTATIGGYLVTASGNNSHVLFGTGAKPLIFYTDSADRMRIDSSGNLLVGKTNDADSGTGVRIRSDGLVQATRANSDPLSVNRTGSDGDIAVFRKDGTPVGSIGANSSKMYIAAGGNGLRFSGGDPIEPTNGSGTLTDNKVDLGSSSYRFKDLYLSGGVYLGGTGAANKLDDYEEGQWEVVITGETSGSVSTGVNGNYVKVGNMVTAAVYVNTTLDLTSISGVVNISLPMAALSWHGGGSLVYANNFLAGTAEADTYIGLRPLDARVRMMKGSSTSWLSHTDIETASGSKAFMLHVTFQV